MKTNFYAFAIGLVLVLTGCSKSYVSPVTVTSTAATTESVQAASGSKQDSASGKQARGVATRIDVVMFIGQSNDNGLSPVTGIPAIYSHPYSNVLSWDKTSNAAIPYQLGVSDHSITQLIVPSYDNGFGPDAGYVREWDLANPRATTPLFIFKKDLTPRLAPTGPALRPGCMALMAMRHSTTVFIPNGLLLALG